MSMTTTEKLETYRRMLRIRHFELAAADQFDVGTIPGALHTSIGQEAAIVGACMALSDEDYITGTHRSHGHPIGKGADIAPLMAELLGKVTGICKGRGGSMHLADNSVGIIGESAIVGGGIPLATGAGLSAKVRGSEQVSLSFFGDGAVNEGAFAESVNMAAIWKLPVIFFCENNGYAITTSLLKSHGQPEIAKHAIAFGIPGITVDGQDADAVYQVTADAVARARRGEGPTLIEAKTYRFVEHSVKLTLATPYRDPAEVEEQEKHRDPIKLYKAVLIAAGISGETISTVEQDVTEAVAQAVSFAQDSEFPDFTDVHDFMYSHPLTAQGEIR